MAETNNFDYTPANKSRANNEPSFRTDLGSNCHFNQFTSAVPVFVITDLDGNILASNNVIKIKSTALTDYNSKIDALKTQVKNAYVVGADGKVSSDQLTIINQLNNSIYKLNQEKSSISSYSYINEWLVTGVKSTVTRFFSCSTLTVMLSCDISDGSMYSPSLPEALQQERDICVWGGYIESIRPILKSDLTTNLLRIFTGIIDTVQFTGSGTGGHTIALSCRDRLKWLMDTSNTFDIGSIQGDTISRSQLILQIAQKGIGYIPPTISGDSGTAVETDKSIKRIISKGVGIYVHDLAESYKTKPLTALEEVPSFENIYLSNITDNTKSAPLAGNTTCTLKVNRDPAFYIYTSRVGISTQNTAQLMIRQQHPIDMIKTLTMQEVYPTEMFQSHVDGNFYYYPRASDYNSLNDPKRYFRTYFFRTVPSLEQKDFINYNGYPSSIKVDDNTVFETTSEGNFQLKRVISKTLDVQGPVDTRSTTETNLGSVTNSNTTIVPLLPPDPNQMLVSLRYEQSSIGVFTNFILYKSNTHDQLVTTEWTMHLELIPDAFYGRDGKQVPIANKFVRIEDPNIKTPAEGAAVLLNAARVYARAVQVASIIINGDPSVTPGEVFQIFGAPLLVNDGLPSLLQDRNNFLKMKTLSITSFQNLALATSATNKENSGVNATATETSNINANLLNTPNTTASVTPENYKNLSASDKEKYVQVKLYNGSVLIAGLDQGKTGDKAVTSDDILTKTSNKITRGADIIPEPKTIFRAEAISHKFNIGASRGYLTEVSLTTTF